MIIIPLLFLPILIKEDVSATSFDVLEGQAYDNWSIEQPYTELNQSAETIQEGGIQGKRVKVIRSLNNSVMRKPIKIQSDEQKLKPALRVKKHSKEMLKKDSETSESLKNSRKKTGTRKWNRRFRTECKTIENCQKYGGHCKKECKKGEVEVPKACNQKNGCKCCKSKGGKKNRGSLGTYIGSKPGDGARRLCTYTTNACKIAGGSCIHYKESCNNVVPDLCDGASCQCCKLGDGKLGTKDLCKNEGGVCIKSCDKCDGKVVMFPNSYQDNCLCCFSNSKGGGAVCNNGGGLIGEPCYVEGTEYYYYYEECPEEFADDAIAAGDDFLYDYDEDEDYSFVGLPCYADTGLEYIYYYEECPDDYFAAYPVDYFDRKARVVKYKHFSAGKTDKSKN